MVRHASNRGVTSAKKASTIPGKPKKKKKKGEGKKSPREKRDIGKFNQMGRGEKTEALGSSPLKL